METCTYTCMHASANFGHTSSGYDSMGYALSKPNLRAELEADLRGICEGVKVKEGTVIRSCCHMFHGVLWTDVIQATLEKYKDVFMNANQQVHYCRCTTDGGTYMYVCTSVESVLRRSSLWVFGF